QDGAIYFCLGGRNTQGGVFRIVATTPVLAPMPASKAVEPRSDAIRRLGYQPSKDAEKELTSALKGPHPFVRRIACESMIRLGMEPALGDLRPLLGSEDRFLRTAARLVLQRVDPKKWALTWI